MTDIIFPEIGHIDDLRKHVEHKHEIGFQTQPNGVTISLAIQLWEGREVSYVDYMRRKILPSYSLESVAGICHGGDE